MNEPVESYLLSNREFVHAFDRWLQIKNYSPLTHRSYADALDKFCHSLGAEDLKAADVRRLRMFLAQYGQQPEIYRNTASPYGPSGQRLGRPPELDPKKISALRAQGLSLRAIAKELDVGVGTLYRVAPKRSKIRENFGTR